MIGGDVFSENKRCFSLYGCVCVGEKKAIVIFEFRTDTVNSVNFEFSQVGHRLAGCLLEFELLLGEPESGKVAVLPAV